MIEITKDFVKEKLPQRPLDANKGTMGTLLNISGSYSMAGACVLSSLAALRSGVGLVKVALPQSIYPIVASNVLEAVYLPIKDSDNGTLGAEAVDYLLYHGEHSDAVLLGCGLKLTEDTISFVRDFLQAYTGVVLVDADGINALSKNIDVLRETKATVVLTPHPKEMSRLTKKDVGYINQNREQTALDFAKEFGVILLLKGRDTVVTDGRSVYVNKTGNCGMAKGGCGDVLSGIIASLMAQGVKPYDATLCSAYIHGRAGDIAALNLSKTAMLPSDIVACLPSVFKEFETE